MRKLILFTLITVATPSLWADRSVTIAVPENRIEITNGSPVTVTYSVACYDKTTGTNIAGAATQTLASKASIEYSGPGTCAGGANPSYKHSAGAFGCSGTNTNFAGAPSLCGPQSSICTAATLIALGVTSIQNFPQGHIFDIGATNWFSTFDNWGKNYPQTQSGGGKNYAPRVGDNKATTNYKCSTTASGGISFCTYIDVNSNSGTGAICCPANNGFKSCLVTIHSATPSTGYLQSPQFKGGTAF